MEYQWYPGHMTKAVRQMKEDLKLIDLVIEVVDARIPISSRNPDIDKMASNKYRLVIHNKADLADPKANEAWAKWYESKGIYSVMLDSRKKNGMKDVNAVIEKACAEKIERDRKRGIINRPLRAMVCGIPNVGKSTFINSFAGKAVAKTANRPGVTRGKQWIRLNKNVELLDTPGILWPKFDDKKIGLNLALTGSMNDQIFNIDDMAFDLIKYLKEIKPSCLSERYDATLEMTENEIIESCAKKRGCLKKGGEADLSKACALIMDDFRSGTLGRISLELPENTNEEGVKETL